MPAHVGHRLRILVAQMRLNTAKGELDNYPHVAEALAALEASVNEHFPLGRNTATGHRSIGHPAYSAAQKLKSLRWKLDWARRANRQAEAKLQALTQAKSKK